MGAANVSLRFAAECLVFNALHLVGGSLHALTGRGKLPQKVPKPEMHEPVCYEARDRMSATSSYSSCFQLHPSSCLIGLFGMIFRNVWMDAKPVFAPLTPCLTASAIAVKHPPSAEVQPRQCFAALQTAPHAQIGHGIHDRARLLAG